MIGNVEGTIILPLLTRADNLPRYISVARQQLDPDRSLIENSSGLRGHFTMFKRWLHKGGSGDAGEIATLVRSRIPFAEEYYDLLSYEASPFGGYRLCPNQQQPHLKINSLGFRGADFTG